MIKNIIFDFDGTLINSNDAVINSLKETYKIFLNDYPSYGSLENVLGEPLEEQLNNLGLGDFIEEALICYRDEYRSVRDMYTLEYEGIREMLEEIKKLGINMFIVSNKGQNGLNHGLEKFGYGEFFKYVIGKDDIKPNKPNRKPFEFLIDKFGGDVSEYIMVGDSISDIEFGKNSGIKTILVSWTLIPLEKFSNSFPDFIANKPEDIIEIIKSDSY